MAFYLIHYNCAEALTEEKHSAIAEIVRSSSGTYDMHTELWDNYTWLIQSDRTALKIGSDIRSELSEGARLIVAEISHGNTKRYGPLDERFKKYFWDQLDSGLGEKP